MLCCEGVKFAFARGRSVLCIACLMFVTETNINGVENSQPQMLPSKRDEFGQRKQYALVFYVLTYPSAGRTSGGRS